MTSGNSDGDDRDDALGWAGDDDPTLVSGDETGGSVRAAGTDADTDSLEPPEGWTVTGPASAVEEKRAADAALTRTATSSLALVSLGIFGGVYLLYT
ncbi:MAG: hypothetical protein LH624_14055, partial [Cryobacterium sp.]|nr:hypothetical protein [Cryobacterium sp.]